MQTLAEKLYLENIDTDRLKEALNEKFNNEFLENYKENIKDEKDILQWILSECIGSIILYELFKTEAYCLTIYELAEKIEREGINVIYNYFSYQQMLDFYEAFNYTCEDIAINYELNTGEKINVDFSNLIGLSVELAEQAIFEILMNFKEQMNLFLNSTRFYKYTEFLEQIEELKEADIEIIESAELSLVILDDLLNNYESILRKNHLYIFLEKIKKIKMNLLKRCEKENKKIQTMEDL